MKEFVERLGIAHQAVNAVESPESVEFLRSLGLEVPAAVLGDKGSPGVDLVAVAKLAGIDYTPPEMLSPATLRARYLRVMDVAQSLIGQASETQLEYVEPDRPRTLRELALHIATIMRGFVDIEGDNIFREGYEYMTPELVAGASPQDVLDTVEETLKRFERWWDLIGSSDPFDRVVGSDIDRFWTLHEAFERAVWHTTQHTRQLQFFVENRLDLKPVDKLTQDDLAGLPLPQGIHAAADG